jgi:succinate-semialdehyde dehydrogenase/glutarate-semialdehyde dehydrogenase
VHNEILENFLKTLTDRVAGMKAGNGLEQGVTIGPLVNNEAVVKVEKQVADAVVNGAEVLCGGHRLTDGALGNGHFFAPTVLNKVTPEMLIYREETFGPVAAVIPFDDNDDLLSLANDTHYGLAAYIYSQNLTQAMRLFEGLQFGIIGINDINPASAAAPFGGMKDSGLGREGSREGIYEYLETKVGGFSI